MRLHMTMQHLEVQPGGMTTTLSCLVLSASACSYVLTLHLFLFLNLICWRHAGPDHTLVPLSPIAPAVWATNGLWIAVLFAQQLSSLADPRRPGPKRSKWAVVPALALALVVAEHWAFLLMLDASS